MNIRYVVREQYSRDSEVFRTYAEAQRRACEASMSGAAFVLAYGGHSEYYVRGNRTL
jgi:hypothetical protein